MSGYARIVLLLFSLGLFLTYELEGQCSILDTAIFTNLTLARSSNGTSNRSGLAYNPHANLYYSVNAGSPDYPLDVYDRDGVRVSSPPQGFDYRGAWWNPQTDLMEGNGVGIRGIFIQTLKSGSSYPTGLGTQIFEGAQPDNQSVGDLDTDLNEIIYYHGGYIHRYDRRTNEFLGQYLVTGLPVALSSINSNTVVYTGCKGNEIGIYDFENQRLLLINKQTRAYSSYSQLPASAPKRSSFGMTYANGLFWLYDNGQWIGYKVVETCPINTELATDLTSLTSMESGADYQWLDCDNGNVPIVGANSRSFSPGKSGNYAVEITRGGCTDTTACYYMDISKFYTKVFTLDSAIISDITLKGSQGGTENRSGLVYHPQANLYYSFNAGRFNYNVDTYDKDGIHVYSTSQGFDYRGAWWNPLTAQLEGNGVDTSGVFVQTLDAVTEYPTGSGPLIFTGNQPDPQSVGDLDTDFYEIIYYHNGFIYRYDRKNNGLLEQFLISGLPVELSDINSNSVAYTGIKGKEIAIYNFADQRILFVNKETGAFNGFTQLSASAAKRSYFGMSYANGLLWLFNEGSWQGYQIVDTCSIDTTVVFGTATLTSNESNASYQWLDCNNGNNPVEGATSKSFIPESSGNYALTITKGACSYTTSCYSFEITSRLEDAFRDQLLVYPNPTEQALNIELGDQYLRATITIRDVSGRIVSSGEYKETNKVIVNLPSPGIYFVQIFTDDGNTETVKVIRN